MLGGFYKFTDWLIFTTIIYSWEVSPSVYSLTNKSKYESPLPAWTGIFINWKYLEARDAVQVVSTRHMADCHETSMYIKLGVLLTNSF